MKSTRGVSSKSSAKAPRGRSLGIQSGEDQVQALGRPGLDASGSSLPGTVWVGDYGRGDQEAARAATEVGLNPSGQAVAGAKPSGLDVSYQAVSLSDLVIERVNKEFFLSDRLGRFEKTQASPRFLQSLGRRSGVRSDFFQLFPPREVLERVIAVDGDQSLVLTCDGVSALAVSKPGDPIIRLADALSVIEGFGPSNVTYAAGELRAQFSPLRSGGGTTITGEDYAKKFQLTIPIDGLNHPSISPLLIREICTNGMVGEAPAFTSQITIGKGDAGFTIGRALTAYNGDQLFSRIAERLELSKKSWASVAEVGSLVKFLLKADVNQVLSRKLIESVWNTCGTGAYLQYLKNNGTSPKLLRKLATQLSRYDLINMITEARTHVMTKEGDKRQLDALVGTMIVRDPDLELSAEDEGSSKSQAFFFNKIA